MSSWMIFVFLQYLVSCVTHDEGVSERSEVSAMSSWMIFLFLLYLGACVIHDEGVSEKRKIGGGGAVASVLSLSRSADRQPFTSPPARHQTTNSNR